MLAYGERNGAPEALAVVSTGNKPSRLMLEKHGFIIITEWSYSSISKPIKLKKKKSAATHLANLDELEKICCYLANSSIFQESAKSYVNSWRWYLLDRHTVRSFISRSSLVVTGDPIEGVALLNADGYWNRRDVIQIVYLDSMLEDSINDLLSFVARIYSERGFSHLHIFCHARLAYNKLIGFEIEESERFLVYRKNLLLPSK
jgi:hypothetical protein